MEGAILQSYMSMADFSEQFRQGSHERQIARLLQELCHVGDRDIRGTRLTTEQKHCRARIAVQEALNSIVGDYPGQTADSIAEKFLLEWKERITQYDRLLYNVLNFTMPR